MKPLIHSGNRAAMPSVALIWPDAAYRKAKDLLIEHKLFRIT
ncbi:MAG: hypothetical protein VB142_11430 [Burkholderia sp.]